MPALTVELKGRSETYELTRPNLTIGRSRSADIRIAHPSVSGTHARLTFVDGSLKLEDAGSKHGILVCDQKVSDIDVMDGLAVRIGKATLTFKTGGGQARADYWARCPVPVPGRPGISPPPVPGSGLGTTPLKSHARRLGDARFFSVKGLTQAARSASSLGVSLGLHAFAGIVLSLCVYRQVVHTRDSAMSMRIRPAKEASAFTAPENYREGDGAGSPLGKSDFAKALPPPAGSTSLDDDVVFRSGGMDETAPVVERHTQRTDGSTPQVSGLSKRNALRKFVRPSDLAPDAPSKPVVMGAGESPVNGTASGEPLDIKKGDDIGELVRGNLDKQGNGGWKTIAQLDPKEILVVTGEYDHVQRVFDKLKVRYTLVEGKRLADEQLRKARLVLLNCPGELDAGGGHALRKWVDNGGWLASTDWALGDIIRLFPGMLDQTGLTGETWVRIEPLESSKQDPLLRDVFNFKGENPRWYLEERSYLFKVNEKAKDKVKILIESAEMKKKFGAAPVAVTFDSGKGKVLHIVSHLQQVSTDPKAHYAMSQLVANWLILATAGR
jgi:hypothetical protein